MGQEEWGGSTWCGRYPSGSQPCLVISRHTHLLPLLSPAAILPAHSSSVLAVPAPMPNTPPHLLLPLSAQHLPAPPFPGCLVQPHPPRGPSVSPSASAASRMANQAGASAGTVATQPLAGTLCPPPPPPPRAWAPHPRLGCMVSAGLPWSTETWLQPHIVTSVQAGEPTVWEEDQHSPPPAATARSWSGCSGGRGWCCQGTGWLKGEMQMVPGCVRSPHGLPPSGAASYLLSPLARLVRRRVRQDAALG